MSREFESAPSMTVASASDFKLHRLAMLTEPEPGNPQEVQGVLNPAAVRGPAGKMYLFPSTRGSETLQDRAAGFRQ